MGTAGGDVERLRAYTRGAHEGTEEVRNQALALAALLEDLARAPNELGGVPTPDLARHLEDLARRMAELDALPGRVAEALAQVGVPFAPVGLRGGPQHPVEPVGDVRRTDDDRLQRALEAGQAWQAWLDDPATRALVAQLEDHLRPALWRLRRLGPDQVLAATDLLRSLEGAQLEAVLRSLDPADLRRLLASLRRSTLRSELWTLDERHDFFSDLAPHLTLAAWRYLASLTDDLDPPIGGNDERLYLQDLYVRARYAPFDGVLAVEGVRQDGHAFGWRDIRQGNLGSCATLAVLMAMAQRRPQLLDDMVTRHPNGLVTVTFPDGHRVTVSADLPEHPDRPGVPLFAGLNSIAAWHAPVADPDRRHVGRWVTGQEQRASDVPGTWELWPMLLEKAYAQRSGGWEAIESRTLEDVLEEWTGVTPDPVDPTDPGDLRRRLAEQQVVIVGTRPDWQVADDPLARAAFEDPWLANRHGYLLVGLDDGPGGPQALLANPWDAAHPPQPLPLAHLDAVAVAVTAARLPGSATSTSPARTSGRQTSRSSR